MALTNFITPRPSNENKVALNMVTSTGNDSLSPIAAQIEQDAAQNGLTAWGFSFLKLLGRTIKSEWLKESSREWFNKPPVDPSVPPKEDFIKFVEPLAHVQGGGESQFATDRGVNALRAKYELPVNSIFKGREDILLREPVTPTGTPEEQMQQFNAARSAFEKENPTPPMGTPLGDYSRKWRTFRDQWKPTETGATPPAAILTVTPPPALPASNTFLPPYLQPGAGAGAGTGVGAPGITPPPQSFVPRLGAPPITLPGSPLTPFVPQAFAGQSPITPGLPMAGVPRTGFGGGFAQTAKLLELPFYLRNFGRTAYG